MTDEGNDPSRNQLIENPLRPVWDPGKGKLEKKTFSLITDRCHLSAIQLGNGLLIEMNIGTGKDDHFGFRNTSG